VNHSKVRARLNEYLERDLPTRERDRVASHLAQCPECRAELRDLEATVVLLRRLPDPELPPAFAETVMARVRAGEADPRGPLAWLRRLSEPTRAIPAALGILALAVGIGSWRETAGVPELATLAAVEPARPGAAVPVAGASEGVRQARLRQLEHLNQLMREGRREQVASILRGAGHPHSASLARHIEAGTTIVLASHSLGR
jgi:anti-sigma factor RsiW